MLYNLAGVLNDSGRLADAISQYQAALAATLSENFEQVGRRTCLGIGANDCISQKLAAFDKQRFNPDIEDPCFLRRRHAGGNHPASDSSGAGRSLAAQSSDSPRS